MDDRKMVAIVGIAFVGVLSIGILGFGLSLVFPNPVAQLFGSTTRIGETQVGSAAFTAQPQLAQPPQFDEGILGALPLSLEKLYDQVGPGVVNIRVFIENNGMVGQAAGSGFIIDEQGYIVTNNHVVADATRVTVIYFNGIEAEAEIVGTDADSDLAVIKVDQLIDDVHPIPLGDSDTVDVGQWVIAIGNPFGNQNSMSIGIVSAVGRTIPTGVTPFSIPQSIQTDAAINPGNSGGPLLNLLGQVVGINAQIATGGDRANSGVGFAIPVNILRKIAPVLIENGSYDWPWLGVEGTDVNLAIMNANNLDEQRGAYINGVVEGGPASVALRGTTETVEIERVIAPLGGDVVIEADGQPIRFFSDLLVAVAFKNPGDQINLTILRDGERLEVSITLGLRP
ncbi:MAG: trypsin-like peptidase domain-containing protein [Chloroflexi bacterium]|nr:trypsin-like peptidase domain-containing protein [Chloroflexota bacterium]